MAVPPTTAAWGRRQLLACIQACDGRPCHANCMHACQHCTCTRLGCTTHAWPCTQASCHPAGRPASLWPHAARQHCTYAACMTRDTLARARCMPQQHGETPSTIPTRQARPLCMTSRPQPRHPPPLYSWNSSVRPAPPRAHPPPPTRAPILDPVSYPRCCTTTIRRYRAVPLYRTLSCCRRCGWSRTPSC